MSNSFKTVLAPNAPWPARDVPMDKNLKSQQPKPKKPAKLNLGGNLDFFAEAHDQINQAKFAVKSRVRDGSTGRFASRQRLSG